MSLRPIAFSEPELHAILKLVDTRMLALRTKEAHQRFESQQEDINETVLIMKIRMRAQEALGRIGTKS